MANDDKKYKILYFEDDNSISEMYETRLRMEGIDPVIRTNPTLDPVGLVLKEKPDLIMMDVVMPVMDGFSATRILKQDERTKNVPIIMLTNLGRQDEVERGISFGANDYFIKVHYTPGELIEKIRKYLGNPKP